MDRGKWRGEIGEGKVERGKWGGESGEGKVERGKWGGESGEGKVGRGEGEVGRRMWMKVEVRDWRNKGGRKEDMF